MQHIWLHGRMVHLRWLDSVFWAQMERLIEELDRYQATAKARKAERLTEAA
jgi:hypothetical protein